MILEHHAEKFVPLANGCWIWTGAVSVRGRPYVKVGKKSQLVARPVCEAVHGPPPTSKHQAAHDTQNGCFGKLCVSPHHLRWATNGENQQDIPSQERSERSRRANAAQTAEQRSDRQKRAFAALTAEERSDAARRANAAQTPEERSARQRRAAVNRLKTTTPEQRSVAAYKMWETRRKKKE